MYFGDYYMNRRSYNDPEYHSVPSIMHKYYLSSTPLNEAFIAMDSIIGKFRKDYRTDKVALVTLTDGSANSINHKCCMQKKVPHVSGVQTTYT